MELIPINEYVICEEIQEKEKIIRGIIIPATTKSNVQKNHIISKSDKCEQVDVGDIVISNTSRGTRFTIDDKEFIALSERELICKIKE